MTRNWFSNFIPFDQPLVFEGISYPTPEHYYQAMKVVNRGVRQELASLPPGACKKKARTLILRPDWEDIKLGVMRHALEWKFARGTTHRAQLDATEGMLIEWNTWHDLFWGCCTCNQHNGQGWNHLGLLLVSIREGL